MALWIGLPVARSQTTVVSRWLAMPTPARSPARDAGLGQRRPRRLDDRAPQVLWVVLDPARPRVVLRELLLADADDLQRGVKQDRPGRGGALIDREDKSGHAASASCFHEAAGDLRAALRLASGSDFLHDRSMPVHATSFVALNGGTMIEMPASASSSGMSEIFVSGAAPCVVQAQTFFIL